MTAAVERGDLDEAARQGMQAGPAIVAKALHAKSRTTVLAGIAAAPMVEDRAELLPDLARVAGAGDRRTAIPAARAAKQIADAMTKKDLPDDLAPEDVQEWRASFEQLAITPGRPIALRITSLEVASSLEHVIDRDELGFDLGKALADSDPLLRIAALELVPRPLGANLRAQILPALADRDDGVALAAANILCVDDDKTGVDPARVKTLVKAHPQADAARCLR
ncbi:MAG TPA: hypothetical protein VGC41_06860 [Kofleriaceae bacterium]